MVSTSRFAQRIVPSRASHWMEIDPFGLGTHVEASSWLSSRPSLSPSSSRRRCSSRRPLGSSVTILDMLRDPAAVMVQSSICSLDHCLEEVRDLKVLQVRDCFVLQVRDRSNFLGLTNDGLMSEQLERDMGEPGCTLRESLASIFGPGLAHSAGRASLACVSSISSSSDKSTSVCRALRGTLNLTSHGSYASISCILVSRVGPGWAAPAALFF
mmetsp:Transcript_74818/g.161832  ORF Transcript_74818/g.161832 Transcript_74818/m.161832 type:complete len:213 (-) Transcript_74818:146-784(-)